MINYNNILSSFNDKGTLLKWLKKLENALNNGALSTVEVITVDATHIKFKFIFADSTFVLSPSITLPRGETGATGATGPQGPQGPTGPQGPQGTLDLATLKSLLEGSDYISVDYNDGQTKILIELDETNLEVVLPSEDSVKLITSGAVFNTLSNYAKKEELEDYATKEETETALQGKLNSSKSDVASVGGLVTPTAVLASNELVGVGVNGEQVRIQLGEGLTLEGSTSPYTLKASGGGGTQLYKHSIRINNIYSITLYSDVNTQVTSVENLYIMIEMHNVISKVAYDYDDFVSYKFEGIKVDDTYKLKALVLSSVKYVSGGYKFDYTILTSINTITDTVASL